MSKLVYVITLEGEPLYVYSAREDVFKKCKEWFEHSKNDYKVKLDFDWWVKDRGEYPDTDEEYEKAWADYIKEQFEEGTWDDYAWYEVLMD